ncbi:MAG: NAD(P)/FAD-dependent oxidoreductase [Chthoniobacterales bacterium]
MKRERIVIAGGGAAGFFAAIACAQARPETEVIIFERTSHFLSKVRISGGGRCNVTHRPLEPRIFCSRYPRGERALLSALHRFSAEDTAEWFRAHGVNLKTEADGRIFPVTDSSGTVIDCLLFEARAAGVQMFSCLGIEDAKSGSDGFDLRLSDGRETKCDRLLLATGGARDPSGPRIAHSLGHTVAPPVPSLFALHLETPWLRSLPGVSVAEVQLTAAGMKLRERGPLLITHQGISGPVVLRFSAWGARLLAERDYQFVLRANWLPDFNQESLLAEFQARRSTQPKKRVASAPIAPLPARLWEKLVEASDIPAETLWNNLTRAHALALVRQLLVCELPVTGKSLNKDEFVTCGGVALDEVNFKTMESRVVPRLYFAGELLDIDGITGGFNFQSAWTTGYLAGRAMAAG